MEVRTFFSALKTKDIWITSKTFPGKAATISVLSIAQGTKRMHEWQEAKSMRWGRGGTAALSDAVPMPDDAGDDVDVERTPRSRQLTP